MGEQEQIKAVGLLSGGLDSTLATRILLEQGIRVTALHFITGFSYVERNRVAGRAPVGPSGAERAAAMLGVDLEVIDVSDAYLPLILHPRYGYGSGMNPCLDCRIFMLRNARAWMEKHGCHFVFTGEVAGQRPKSQMRPSLRTAERESGLRGYLLRPLSAKLLEPTVPELQGWVDRERLYGISGKGRREQIALAGQFGITEYAQPSGGCCYLIDRTYSRRLRDFLEHEGAEPLSTGQVELLAIGRHLRLSSGRKVVVGRHARENDYLEASGIEGVLLRPVEHPGPTALVSGTPARGEIEQVARVVAGYSDRGDERSVRVAVYRCGGQGTVVETLTVEPLVREEIQALMV